MRSELDADEGGSGDKVTIRTSVENKEVLELLVKQGHFNTQLGAFQAAAILALRKKLDVTQPAPAGGLTWNRGSVDRDLLDFLEWYGQSASPATLLEQLGNRGTSYIAEKVKTGGYTFTEIFELPNVDIE